MRFHSTLLATGMALAAVVPAAGAAESVEFVAEHLAEIAMDDRYASLPLWSGCDDTCFSAVVSYAQSHSGTLSIAGPMLSLGVSKPIGETLRLSAFAFFDDFALRSGVEHRPLEVTFASPPLALPSEAEFTGLDGDARDTGIGIALNGTAHWRWLSSFEWSAGLMWQQFHLNDYRFDYRVLEGPDTGATGLLDYSSTYSHISPFVGAAWPRSHGVWHYTPHLQAAWPLPRRGIAGHITGPGFDLTGNTDEHGNTPFGDPSLTIGFNVTYEPWDLTVDIGTTISQVLLEPLIHEGVSQNLMISTSWNFD
jgi:hypothetical protein